MTKAAGYWARIGLDVRR